MNGTNLTQGERHRIHALRRQGVRLARIAAELNRHRSTISRELLRNSGSAGYKPASAHTQARTRQCVRRNAKEFSSEQWSHVHAYLRLHLSPQQTSGRLKLEKAITISHECIYLHTYQTKPREGTWSVTCAAKRRVAGATPVAKSAEAHSRTASASSSVPPYWTNAAVSVTGRAKPSLAKTTMASW